MQINIMSFQTCKTFVYLRNTQLRLFPRDISGSTLHRGSLSVGHSESRWMTNELGSRQRDLSTSSVTKRANGHWHAIIASSCRWSQREYKRQSVHRINHPFASEPSGGASLLLFLSLRVRSLSECGHSSGGRGLTGEQRSVKTVTTGVCGGQLPCVLQH